MIVGGLFVVVPGVFGQEGVGLGLAPGPKPSQYLVKIAPGNYSYLSYNMRANAELTVTISAGTEAVDFYLMNEGNFSMWNRASSSSSQVYPQSALNVKNYSFDISGPGTAQTYYLVFVSRSASSQTDVLVHYSLQVAPDSSVAALPTALLGIGVILALAGARFGGKKGGAEVVQAASPPPPTDAGRPKCKYCGAELTGDTGFCSSCGRSQG